MSDESKLREDDGNAELTFHYLQSKDFRVVVPEGAIGSRTPAGKLFLAFYVERAPIPRSMTYSLDEDGELGSLRNVEKRDGIVRDMQVGLLLDDEAAHDLFNLLSKYVDVSESSVEEATEEVEGETDASS